MKTLHLESLGMDSNAFSMLREALRLSPENLPLRLHLAASLLKAGEWSQAETEYRQALTLAPENRVVKLGLAQTYYAQGKYSHALVIVEDLIKAIDASAETILLHARLLLAAGDERRAASMYRRAVESEPDLADPELAEELGVTPEPMTQFPTELEDERRLRAAWDELDSEIELPIERPKITFGEVGGMEAVKEEIRLKIIYPLTHVELYKAYGKTIGGGILLYGPPGCGKTHLARATAGEIQAGFLAIGINDVLDMWIGNSEKNLHSLFEQARLHTPCVLFFDEVDALGGSRSDLKQSGARHLVNQFLAELDGVESSNEGVLILAATNAPWQMDNAFRRPGRFDRIVFVPPPDLSAREEILRIIARGKPLDAVDFAQIARKTEEFSGADLKAVLDLAIEAKLREALKDKIPRPMTTKDLLAAVKLVKPSTRDWFATARNHALYANQGGLYDDVLKYLRITS